MPLPPPPPPPNLLTLRTDDDPVSTSQTEVARPTRELFQSGGISGWTLGRSHFYRMYPEMAPQIAPTLGWDPQVQDLLCQIFLGELCLGAPEEWWHCLPWISPRKGMEGFPWQKGSNSHSPVPPWEDPHLTTPATLLPPPDKQHCPRIYLCAAIAHILAWSTTQPTWTHIS